MASRVVMPKLTETMEEGLLIKWYKKEGDKVESGDALAEIETDKAVTDLESYASGILKKVLVPPESVVPAGDLIAVVADPDEDVSEMVKKEKPRFRKRGEEAKPVEEGKKQAGPSKAAAETSPPTQPETPPPQKKETSEQREIKASPLAKRVAQEHGLDLTGVEGTGPGGRITEKDVERYLEKGEAKKGEAAPPPRERQPAQQSLVPRRPVTENPFEDVPLTLMRKTIAKRMAQSLAPVPHFFVTTDVEMTEVLRYREGLPEVAPGVKITIGDLIVKAAALALRDFPNLRASFMGEKIRIYRRIDIGLAVGFEEGLTTVVIRDCDNKGLTEIRLESRDLIQRAKTKALKPEEYTGAVFSVSNLGMFDVDAFTAIITPPEAAALAVGSVTDRPKMEGGEWTVGKFMKATLSTDHRAADGLMAAQYLKTFKGILQNPLGLAL